MLIQQLLFFKYNFLIKKFFQNFFLINTKNIKLIIIINKVIIINTFNKYSNFIFLFINNKLNFNINLIKYTLVLIITFFYY